MKSLSLVTALMSLLFPVTMASAAPELSGTVKIDGSSTVYPITEAMAEEFGKLNPKVKVTIGVSGTGGGFKKFTTGETDISNASRHMKAEEKAKATENKITYVEVPVAYDGLTVVINKENTWAKSLTVAQLKQIWEPSSKIKTWKDVNPAWPDKAIKLYGPGTDSGTFDFFTEVINGKAQASRSDFTMSEDDNMLVAGVEGDKNALGYFGFSYYVAHQKRLSAVAIDNGKGPVAPTEKTVLDGTYAPLSRPLFVYVSKKSLARPEVDQFVSFLIQEKNNADIVKSAGYLPLTKKDLTAANSAYTKFKAAK